MKQILLHSLSLRNFKGILDLTVQFGKETSIFGANESGKSTICTAFYWLLTGKDEFDRKDYEIKNTKKCELNSQAHEVEGVFLVDGREVKLKRVYLEKWTKPKGQSTKVFEGHYTDYYYNDVPCSLAEYQSKVDELISSKIIKLVTNPTYFNSLKWDDQRRGLIGIAGLITDGDIFASIATPANDYSTLIMVLNSGKSAEEYKKELAAKKLLLKKAATEYAPRIDEAKRNKPETLDWPAIEKQITKKKAAIQSIDDMLTDATKAFSVKQQGITEKRKQVFVKQGKLAEIRNDIKTELLSKQNDGAGDIASVQSQIRSTNENISRLQGEISQKENNIKGYTLEVERLDSLIAGNRAKWSEINAERFVFDDSKCECPTCHQALPQDKIEVKKAELLLNFNESVAGRKADEVRKSDRSKAEKATMEQNIKSAAASIETLKSDIEAERSKLPALEDKLTSLQNNASKKPIVDIDAAIEARIQLNGDALNLHDEIAELEAEIKAATDALGEQNSYEDDKSKKASIQLELDELKKQLAVKESIEKTDARIAQLEKEEKANAQELANLERQEFEVETYTRAKMDILEKRVNSMFKYVSFRLFEKQVNGGIAETCVCEYKGVPYPTLNTAAKMLAGLDVLDTFSRFYNVYAPVFCDNRESVTIIPDISSQVINLYVSEPDSVLRIEAA